MDNDLALKDIPDPGDQLGAIFQFALTFNGYEHHGSFEKCADIANERRNDTLLNLRTCLFFEQRRWRHMGEEPDDEAMKYIRMLVREIRAKVEEGLD